MATHGKKFYFYKEKRLNFFLHTNFIKIVWKINEISTVQIEGNYTILTHFQYKLG